MLNLRVVYIAIPSLLCIASIAAAQSNQYFEGQNHLIINSFAGKIIPHSDTLKPLTNGLVKGIHLSISQKVNGNKDWHNYHKMPDVGLSFIYIDLGDARVLGNAFGVQPVISYQISKFDRFVIKTHLGLGIAYITEKYSPNQNPTNVAISTTVNYWSNVSLMGYFNLSNRSNLSIGIETNHFSNGAIKKPNYGLNLMGVSIGFSYEIDNKERVYGERSKTNSKYFTSKTGLELAFGLGIKEVGPAGGIKYYPISASVEYQIPRNNVYHLMAGVDVMYDKSIRSHKALVNQPYTPLNDDFQVGIKAGILIPFHRLSIYGQFGFYLYNPNPRVTFHYQKFGIRYRINSNIHLQTELKTHLNIADHVVMGVAFRL